MYRRDTNINNYAAYKKAAMECKAAIRNFKVHKKQVTDAVNSGRFFKYINQKLGRPNNIGILKGKTGDSVLEDAEKANLLNSYFNSVNAIDDKIEPEFQSRIADEVTIDSIPFTPDTLCKICKNIKPKMSSGPDGYPPFLLKNIVSVISSPLSRLCQ